MRLLGGLACRCVDTFFQFMSVYVHRLPAVWRNSVTPGMTLTIPPVV